MLSSPGEGKSCPSAGQWKVSPTYWTFFFHQGKHWLTGRCETSNVSLKRRSARSNLISIPAAAPAPAMIAIHPNKETSLILPRVLFLPRGPDRSKLQHPITLEGGHAGLQLKKKTPHLKKTTKASPRHIPSILKFLLYNRLDLRPNRPVTKILTPPPSGAAYIYCVCTLLPIRQCKSRCKARSALQSAYVLRTVRRTSMYGIHM